MRTSFADRLAVHAANPVAPPAIVRADGEIAYAELHRRVEHAAAWMRTQGVASGDVVGIVVADEIAHFTVSLALLVLGLPQVSLPTFEPPAARLRVARTLGVTRVVAVEPTDGLPGIAASFVTTGVLTDCRPVPPQEPLNADPEATAIYVASSGSTGQPKVIAQTARLLAHRQRIRNFSPRERQLLLTPVEQAFGLSSRLGCAWRGVTSVFCPRSTPAHALGAFCATHRVTRLTVGALQAASLVQDDASPLPDDIDVFVSGSRVPMRLREAFRARGRGRLHVEYGAREVALCCTTFPADPDATLETVGPPAEGAQIEVVDPDGRPLPAGEIGEVRVRTPAMVHGYPLDPAATARHFRDGWFHAGDLGSFTPRGSLCLHGRLDDVINLNGIKIYPDEIERTLERDPAVKTAAAFALRSDVHGQIPVAAVEWQGSGRPDVAALMARTRAVLGVRAPRKIVVVDALPRNASGKVATRDLSPLVDDQP